MPTQNVALRKRTQIAIANRTMFLWVATVSIIVGFSLVLAIFLIQNLMFNERVIAEKEKTVASLKINNDNISVLETNIRVIDTNEALAEAKANPDDQPIQVILDALPAEANSLALGASIQNVLLRDISGLYLNSLQVNPVLGIESLDGDTSVQDASAASSVSQNIISFRFSVTGDVAALRQVLSNLEASIRAIDITSLKIEGQGSNSIMNIQARAFYEPSVTVELRNKTVR